MSTKYDVLVGADISAYAHITVWADSEHEARQKVQAALESEDGLDSPMFDQASFAPFFEFMDNERIVDVTPDINTKGLFS